MDGRKETFLEVPYDIDFSDQYQTFKLRRNINLYEMALKFIRSFPQFPDRDDYFRFSKAILKFVYL